MMARGASLAWQATGSQGKYYGHFSEVSMSKTADFLLQKHVPFLQT